MKESAAKKTLGEYSQPLTGQDIFNYLSGEIACNQIHMVIELEDYLDRKCLEEAIRVIIDIYPILGYQIEENEDGCYFRRAPGSTDMELCPAYHTGQMADDLETFISCAHDARQHPMVRHAIFRQGSTDTLCIKINHACCDGGGLKEYALLLASVYSDLQMKHNRRIENRDTERGTQSIFKNMGISDPLSLWNPGAMSNPPRIPFPFNSQDNKENSRAYSCLKNIPMNKLKTFAHSNGGSINDILLAAAFHALFQATRAEDGTTATISTTADLRQFLPEDERRIVANTSSSFDVVLKNKAGEKFADTIGRIAEVTRRGKENQAYIPIAIFFEVLQSMGITAARNWFQGACQASKEAGIGTMFLSNLGVIEPLSFGLVPAAHAYIVTPAMFAPGLMIGASTYNDRLTLVVNYYRSDLRKEIAQSLLDDMKKNLTFTLYNKR